MTRLDTEVLVVGSGAGGAVTAATLAAAGRRVTVLEEGPWIDADAMEPFSLDEMVAKYRHTGLAAALGTPGIVYAEGRCVGGSTEINSGFWHRTPPDVLAEWQRGYGLVDADAETLRPHFEWAESALSVGPSRRPWAANSRIMARGIRSLGWAGGEIPRAARGRLAVLRKVLDPAYPLLANAVLDREMVERLHGGTRQLVEARRAFWPSEFAPTDALFRYDQLVYLPPLLQRQVRMSMAAGVEARVVFLDHALAETVNAIPAAAKPRPNFWAAMPYP